MRFLASALEHRSEDHRLSEEKRPHLSRGGVFPQAVSTIVMRIGALVAHGSQQTAKLFVVLVALSCTSPSPRFYVLAPHQGASVAGPALRIELRRPELPSYLDRPHVVRRADASELALSGDEHWAAPLAEAVSSAVIENLSQRLPNSSVYSEGGPISSVPNVRVGIELHRFEQDADGRVKLTAQVAVSWPETDETRLERFNYAAQPKGRGTEATVEQMSVLLAKLSDQIALSIAQMEALANGNSAEARTRANARGISGTEP